MGSGKGWMGSWNELSNVLRCFHCDVDGEGRFMVDGGIVSYLGLGEEFVVDKSAVYYVNGEARNLLSALNATSYGMKVGVVIM